MKGLIKGKIKVASSRDKEKFERILQTGHLPYSLLSQRVLKAAPFRHARDGATNALKRVLSHMETCGYIVISAPPKGSDYRGKIYRLVQ